MNLADLQLLPGSSFQIDCRIRSPRWRIAGNGAQYLTFVIEDCSTSLKAYAWAQQCDIAAKVHDLDKLHLTGKVREFNGSPLATVWSIEPCKGVVPDAVNLIPHSLSPEPHALCQLQKLVGRMQNRALRSFLDSVLSDDTFTFQFIRLPASRSHHHAGAGGLLKHSLECAEMVQRFKVFSPDMLDLAVAGALFHDAGKVVTLHRQKYTPEYALLDHDALTLEVLAPHLKHLDRINRDTAVALRYLWTWRHSRRAKLHPSLTVAEAIASVDRISAGLDYEEGVFNRTPKWKNIVCSQSNGSKLWRPQLGYQAVHH